MSVLLFVYCSYVYLACITRSANQLSKMGNCGGQYMYFRDKFIIIKSYMKYSLLLRAKLRLQLRYFSSDLTYSNFCISFSPVVIVDVKCKLQVHFCSALFWSFYIWRSMFPGDQQ